MAQVRIPDSMETPRYRAPRTVDISGEIPMISPDAPDDKKVRQRLEAHCRVFNVSDAKDLADYEALWQRIADGTAVISETTKAEWDATGSRFVVFMRWGEVTFVPPNS